MGFDSLGAASTLRNGEDASPKERIKKLRGPSLEGPQMRLHSLSAARRSTEEGPTDGLRPGPAKRRRCVTSPKERIKKLREPSLKGPQMCLESLGVIPNPTKHGRRFQMVFDPVLRNEEDASCHLKRDLRSAFRN